MGIDQRSTDPRRIRASWLALALFALALALYARTAAFGFVEYDDPSYVRDNPHLAHGLDAGSVSWNDETFDQLEKLLDSA